MRYTIEPRFIRPETICIGDTIRVTYPPTAANDTTRTYTGTVTSRDRIPPLQTLYYTANGVLLLHHIIGEKADYRVTLLDRIKLENITALF